MPVPEGEDATEVYDRAMGTPKLADEQKPSGLTEAGNKPPPQAESFRVKVSK